VSIILTNYKATTIIITIAICLILIFLARLRVGICI
jgi:hypothetical protein